VVPLLLLLLLFVNSLVSINHSCSFLAFITLVDHNGAEAIARVESIKGPVRLIHPLEGVGDVGVYLQLSLEIPLHDNRDIRPAMTQPPNSTLSLSVSLSLSLSLSLARSLARALSLKTKTRQRQTERVRGRKRKRERERERKRERERERERET
jgi:hypothetical protein